MSISYEAIYMRIYRHRLTSLSIKLIELLNYYLIKNRSAEELMNIKRDLNTLKTDEKWDIGG